MCAKSTTEHATRIPMDSGWRPDLPDPRDYSVDHQQVVSLLAGLPQLNRLPDSVDLRGDADGDYLTTVCRSGFEGNSASSSIIAMIEYFERRMRGRSFRGSIPFLHEMAKFLSLTGENDASLRMHFKAMRRYGIPPEDLVDVAKSGDRKFRNDFRLLGFMRDFEAVVYFRIDSAERSPVDRFECIRALLAAGFPITAGISIPTSVQSDPLIPFRPQYESYRGGLVVLLVGYEMDPSSRGHFLFRNCWGSEWGDQGYGKLPFELVRQGHAADFWTIIQPKWVSSSCLMRPFGGKQQTL